MPIGLLTLTTFKFMRITVKIKVALHGMDKRSIDRMLTIFTMNFKGQCEHTDIENSDTVIMDMDDKNVETEWSSFRQNFPDIPVIIMAKDNIKLDGAIYIAKPAKLNELLTSLKETSNKNIETDLTANKSTHNVAKALQNRIHSPNVNTQISGDFGIYYRPAKFLQGKLVQAIEKSNELNKNIFLKCWKDHWILVSPSTNFLLQNIGDNQIKTLGLVPLGDDYDQMSFSEHLFSDNEISHMANTPATKVKVTSIENFLWDLTIKTARGRIPEGTSLDELYVVQRWPNLPRLLHTANASRMTAFWLDRPQSINNIIDKLGVPLEDVLTYFSAANATGILKLAKRKEDALITPEIVKADKKKRGIFSALIQKVSRNIIHKKDDMEQEV